MLKKLLLAIILIVGCKEKTALQKYEQQMEDLLGKDWKTHIEEAKNRPPTFYKPKYLDDCWRSHDPYLEGAEGWISTECGGTMVEDKIIVKGQNLGHKGWGKYEGNLYIEYVNNGKTTNIDFKCFIPNYEVGEWRCKP